MILPNNLSKKEREEWTSKYEAMGIKVDTQQHTTSSSSSSWGTSHNAGGFPFIRTIQQAERELGLSDGSIVEAGNLRFNDNITATNVPFVIRKIEPIESPINIMPPVFGVEALKAHMRELKAFMEDNDHETW